MFLGLRLSDCAGDLKWLHRLTDNFHLRSDLNEIFVNGTRATCYDFGSSWQVESPVFTKEEDFTRSLQQLARSNGLRLDPYHPSCGGMTGGDQFRWHAVLKELAPEGPLFAVRRHRFDMIELDAFDVSPEDLPRLEQMATNARNLFVCGRTGSGKTSLLAALAKKFIIDRRAVIIEAIKEIPLLSPLWVRLTEKSPDVVREFSVPLKDLYREALRMKPEKIILGEVRGQEIVSLIDVLHSCQGGVWTTIHVDSIEQLRHRISYLIQQNHADSASVLLAGVLVDVILFTDQPKKNRVQFLENIKLF